MASLPIRNRATLAGNIVNASPIADMTAILLALDVCVRLRSASGTRELPLSEFFLGYKKTALGPGEFIDALLIPATDGPIRFNFEKVSKREHLDIASANTAFGLRAADGKIVWARLSAGGVAPVPLLLRKASESLIGKRPDARAAKEAARLALEESAPIGDVRGSAEYRSRLLERLILAHFVRLFPDSGLFEELWP